MPIDIAKDLLKKSKHVNFIVALVLLSLCMIANVAQWQNGFAFDDFNFLGDKYQYTYISFADFFRVTESQHFNPLYYLVNVPLFRLFPQPLILRFLNFCLFVINTGLLYYLVYLFTRHRKMAFVTAALFSLHPVNAIILSFITVNFILLSAAFLQASLITYWHYLEKKRPSHYIYSLFYFVIALLFFEGALLYPLYLAAVLYCLKNQSLRQTGKSCLPFLALSGIHFLLWLIIAGPKTHIMAGRFDWSLLEYASTLARLVGWYISNLILPHNLVFIRNMEPTTDLFAWVSLLLFFAGIAALLFYVVRRPRGWVTFALLWFGIGFLLVVPASLAHTYMGLVIEPQWLYFSSMGFFLLLALGLTNLRHVLQKTVWLVVFAGFVGYAFIYTQAIHVYTRTEKSHSHYWLKMSPRNAIPLLTLGKIAMQEDDYKGAMFYYQELLYKTSYQPHLVYHNIGTVWARWGHQSLAKAHFLKALEYNPDYAISHNALGTVYVQEKEYDLAERSFLKALIENPHLLMAGQNLSDLYILSKQETKAIELAHHFLDAAPFGGKGRMWEARLAALYYKQGNKARSEEYVDAILEEDDSAESFLLLAQIFEGLGQSPKAIDLLVLGMESFPDDKDFYLLAGIIHANQQRYEQAIAIWKKGLRIDPKDRRFHDNIEQATKLGHTSPAE